MATLVRMQSMLEVPPAARPNGFVYVHSVQLDEPLDVGMCVEFQDEGGNWLTGDVVAVTTDRLGPRYTLRLQG